MLGEVLTPGLAAALSPMLIVAAIILASSDAGVRRVFIYAFGDFLAMASLGVIAVLAASGADVATRPSRSQAASFLLLLLGVLLWFMAWKTFKNRPAKGEEPPIVRRLSALDQMTSSRILLIGLALGLVNVKNIPLEIGAATTVVQSGAGRTLSIIAMLIFSLLGTLAVLAPGVIVLVAPNSAERVLGGGRRWFIAHNNAISITIFVLLGASMVAKALPTLFS